MRETIDSARVAEITGFTVRWVQMHAARGNIPSAVQLVDGGEWRFDEAAVRAWKKARERQKVVQWQPSIKEAKGGTGALITKGKSSANRLKQILNL